MGAAFEGLIFMSHTFQTRFRLSLRASRGWSRDMVRALDGLLT